LSTTARNAPKNATVAITTQVVATTSSRLGQVTCFISTRNVVQEFARAYDCAGNSFADAGRCSGDGAALRFFILHFDRLRGHEILVQSR